MSEHPGQAIPSATAIGGGGAGHTRLPHRRVPLDTAQPCWAWSGSRQTLGYGHLEIGGVRHYAHRVSYQLHVGPIPRGWELDHVCHSEAVQAGLCAGGPCEHRACWNPAHLEAVSSRENSMRGNHPLFAVARRSVCRRGHDLTQPANVALRPNGKRRCAVCTAEYQRRYWSERRTSACTR